MPKFPYEVLQMITAYLPISIIACALRIGGYEILNNGLDYSTDCVRILVELLEETCSDKSDKTVRLKDKDVLRMACDYGKLEIVKFIDWPSIDPISDISEHDILVRIIVAKGHAHILKWLHLKGKKLEEGLINFACKEGQLEIVEWLHNNWPDGCNIEAMNLAANRGHLQIVKFLNENRTEGCNQFAMDDASEHGHLEVVKYLHYIGKACSVDAMDFASKNGHLEIVKFLNDNRQDGCTTRAMDSSARNGHIEVVRYLFETRTEGCTEYAKISAKVNGHKRVWKFLHENNLG